MYRNFDGGRRTAHNCSIVVRRAIRCRHTSFRNPLSLHRIRLSDAFGCCVRARLTYAAKHAAPCQLQAERVGVQARTHARGGRGAGCGGACRGNRSPCSSCSPASPILAAMVAFAPRVADAVFVVADSHDSIVGPRCLLGRQGEASYFGKRRDVTAQICSEVGGRGGQQHACGCTAGLRQNGGPGSPRWMFYRFVDSWTPVFGLRMAPANSGKCMHPCCLSRI